MKKLFEKLKKYSISDAIKIEESDRQFIALNNLYQNIQNKDFYLPLIISNSLICYQLSGKGEDYWEEFSEYFSKNFVDEKNFLDELKKFLENSKNNKRFFKIKSKRLEKNFNFIEKFFGKEKFFYLNMIFLRDELAKNMNQNISAKTIVFAIKMFSYGARNIFNFQKFPEEIKIPIDSRLENLFEKYGEGEKNSKIFYSELSKKLKIPELHLDAILWVNYKELIK